jgi:hypothetical protein
MKQRCDDPKDAAYKNYGGRGIAYQTEWAEFEVFLADMGESPSGMSLDRIDNDGPYSKLNCRWASRQTQNRNSRGNVVIEYLGEKKLLCEWAEQLGIRYGTLHTRLFKLGWSTERAFKPRDVPNN